jgi:hypothetical protein
MTEIGGEKNLLVCLTREDQFAIGEMSRCEGTVNTDLIFIVGQLFLLTFRHTKAPAFLIIRGHIGNPVRLFGLGIDVLEQFFTTHSLMDGHRIAQHMEVTVLEVDDGLSLQVFDPASPDIPLVGNSPVEDLCA